MVHTVLTIGLVLPILVMPVAASAATPAPTATERTCRGLTATVVGTAGDDRLTGTRGSDVIVGLHGNDRILGLAGDDLVCGNDGADTLVGGRGHDQLYGGRDEHARRGRGTVISGDRLEGGPGDDRLSVGFDTWSGRVAIQRRNSVSFRHSSRAVTVDLGEGTVVGEGSDVVVTGRNLEVTGSRHDDVLRGSPEADILDGGRGDDQAFGDAGRDVVLGYRGDDLLHGEQGADLMISTAGVTTMDGGDGRDWLVASSPAPTTLLGGAGFDSMERRITAGETGVIDGGADRDQLELLTQVWFDHDPSGTLDAEAGTAVVTAGTDTHTTPFTSVDNYTLWGSPWTFRGTEARDFVQVIGYPLHAQGLGSDDYLLGGDRADVLGGGEGTDTAWGGRGRNTCIDAEAGDCDGYPWDTTATPARVAARRATPLAHTAPRTLVARWLNHRSPFLGD